MASTVRKILEDLAKLPESERERVRTALERWPSEGGDPSADAEWDVEIARRVRSLEDGSAELSDHDEVMSELRSVIDR